MVCTCLQSAGSIGAHQAYYRPTDTLVSGHTRGVRGLVVAD